MEPADLGDKQVKDLADRENSYQRLIVDNGIEPRQQEQQGRLAHPTCAGNPHANVARNLAQRPPLRLLCGREAAVDAPIGSASAVVGHD